MPSLRPSAQKFNNAKYASTVYGDLAATLDSMELTIDETVPGAIENFRENAATFMPRIDLTFEILQRSTSQACASRIASAARKRLDRFFADCKKTEATSIAATQNERALAEKHRKAHVYEKHLIFPFVPDEREPETMAAIAGAAKRRQRVKAEQAEWDAFIAKAIKEENADPEALKMKTPRWPIWQSLILKPEHIRSANEAWQPVWDAAMLKAFEAKQEAAKSATPEAAPSKRQFGNDASEVPDNVKIDNIFHSAPHDFWKDEAQEKIESGMLPQIIEDVAFETSERLGYDRDALVMTMLTALSSVIATDIKVCNSNAVDETFKESIRIWLALIGVAGAGKTPILEAVQPPFDEIDDKLTATSDRDKAHYEKLSKDEKKEEERPKDLQLILPDASTESAQVAFNDNENGMLLIYDELVSFFGAKSRYSNGGGADSALGFWLSVYNSRRFKSKRISRADVNCHPSGSIIGGIQPKLLNQLMDDESANNAGLVQRYCPVMMPDTSPAPIENDEPAKFPMTVYWQLVKNIYYHCPLRLTGADLHFSQDATVIKKRFTEWVREKVEYYRPIDDSLASHINKFPGMFLRFCGLYHVIDNWADKQPRLITKETAAKVFRLMTVSRLAHAIAFYNKLRENKQNRDMRGIAEFILEHELEYVSAREIQRGTNRFREISTRDIAHTAGNMVALGWLYHIVKKRVDNFNWMVNKDVHKAFANHAVKAREKAAKAKAVSDRITSEGGRRKRDSTSGRSDT